MARRTERSTPESHPQPGVFTWMWTTPLKIVLWLSVALIFSVITEWIGMTWFWSEQGPAHSRHMLEAEIGYLNADFRESLIAAEPARFAGRIADGAYAAGVEWTGLGATMRTLGAANAPADGWALRTARAIYQPMADYLVAAVTVTQVFSLRLGVLILASPVFALAGGVGLTDGLVERDRRRFGGAREKGLVYHHAKRYVPALFVAAWVVYLSLPVSVHPNFVILPFAALFALALGITAATFKKYL